MAERFGALGVFALGEILCHCNGYAIHALASTCKEFHAMVVACYQQKRCLGFYLSELARLYSLSTLSNPNQDPINASQAFRRCFSVHTCRDVKVWTDAKIFYSALQCLACTMGSPQISCLADDIPGMTGPPVFATALIFDGIINFAKEVRACEEEDLPKKRASFSKHWLQFLSTFEDATRIFLADRHVLRPNYQTPFGWIGRILMLRPSGVKFGTKGILEEKICVLLELIILPSLFHQLHWETVFVWCGVYIWRDAGAKRILIPMCPSPTMLKEFDHSARLLQLISYDPVEFVSRALTATFSMLLWNEAFFILERLFVALQQYISLHFESPSAFGTGACDQYQTGLEHNICLALKRTAGDHVHVPVSFEFCAPWAPEPAWTEKYWSIPVSVHDSTDLLSQQRTDREKSPATAFLPVIFWLQFPVFLKTLLRSLSGDSNLEFHVSNYFFARYLPADNRDTPQVIRKGLFRRCQTLILSENASLDCLDRYTNDPFNNFHVLAQGWNLYSRGDTDDAMYLWIERTLLRFLSASLGDNKRLIEEKGEEEEDAVQQHVENDHSNNNNIEIEGEHREKRNKT